MYVENDLMDKLSIRIMKYMCLVVQFQQSTRLIEKKNFTHTLKKFHTEVYANANLKRKKRKSNCSQDVGKQKLIFSVKQHQWVVLMFFAEG